MKHAGSSRPRGKKLPEGRPAERAGLACGWGRGGGGLAWGCLAGTCGGPPRDPLRYRLTERGCNPKRFRKRPGPRAGRVPETRAASPRPPGTAFREPRGDRAAEARRERRQRPEVSWAQSRISKSTFKDKRSTGQGKRNGRIKFA